MIRLALLTALGLATLGCSTSRKVVIQNGYPGVQPPRGFEARPNPNPGPAPDALHYAPDAPGPASPGDPGASISP